MSRITVLRPGLRVVGLLLLVVVTNLQSAHAGPSAKAGPYRLEVTTDPSVIPVGRATVIVKVSDDAGKPVENARVRVLVEMPGMKMGEREENATPQAGSPGTYRAPAQFPMGGAYKATVTVSAAAGEGSAVLSLATGMSTASGGARFPPWVIAAVVAALGAGAIVLLQRRQGRRLEWRKIVNRQTVSSMILVGVLLVGAVYAVRTFRRPGAMTPIEGQAMEMDMPAPVGSVPVELAPVRHGTVDNVVRYSGQAVGFVEQDVTPRVQGTIVNMPVYVGDRVRRGQILASLDTSQLEPLLAERRADVAMSERQYRVGVAELEQARSLMRQAHTEVGMQTSDEEVARGNLVAARTQVDDARAGLRSAVASQAYWRNQLKRSSALFGQKAISAEEYQKEQASAAEADARAQQARSRLDQVRAQVRVAEASLRRAQTGVTSHEAHVGAAQAAVMAGQEKLAVAQAGIEQARARYAAAAAQRGYAEIRSQVDGIVTQRVISPGVLVSPGQVILRVAQTRPIRLQANVSAADLPRIHKGNVVRVSSTSQPDRSVASRVSSVQPSLDPAARTGIVEAVFANVDERFVPGAYLVMDISTDRSPAGPLVPARAIQRRSSWVTENDARPARSYVWVAEPEQDGTFKVRSVEVRTGASDGTSTAVQGDLKAGQFVVAAGYEALKDGDSVAASPQQAAASPSVSPSATPLPGVGTTGGAATIEVTEKGFEPSTVTLPKGQVARLTFIRRTDKTCGTTLVMPDFKQRVPLPLNKPVVIEIHPDRSGEFKMTCPMDMLQGKVIVP